MRRLLSIVAIVAVVFSALTPLLAAACPHAQQAAACHRMQAKRPHCEMMRQHDADAAVTEDDGLTVSSRAPANCPMDCCVPGHPTSAVTVAVASEFPPLAVVEYRPQLAPVVFIRAGFSSHTDRGPPSA